MITKRVGTRKSIRKLQELYDSGDKKPLEDVVRAWKGIKELPPDDPNSFFILAGYHGEPFHRRKAVDALSPEDTYIYWGGYCNHGNILFPTWHRVYLWRLEKALQSIVPEVNLPFWDETEEDTLNKGIPEVLTQEKFWLDGVEIDNPLRSFVLPESLSDEYWADQVPQPGVSVEKNVPQETSPYFKPKGYETVRYPLTGMVGNPRDRDFASLHNAKYKDPEQQTQMLNDNVKAWLYGGSTEPNADPTLSRKHGVNSRRQRRHGREQHGRHARPQPTGLYAKFQNCLAAPNYTAFSNTTSAAAWNSAQNAKVVSLEEAHNDIHLAVGGLDAPQIYGTFMTGQVVGANGDMGENNTAAMDPIFFFHHCNIDRMFWVWQKLHNATDTLEIVEGYAGTSSNDNQGPTPGIAPSTALDLDTPLNPFMNPDTASFFTSKDCTNIETHLGYTYDTGSLEAEVQPEALALAQRSKNLIVRGIDRALFQGSFVLTAHATVTEDDGTSTKYYLGHYSVFSRWSVMDCANCRTHLEVIAHFPLNHMSDDEIKRAKFSIKVQQRSAAGRKHGVMLSKFQPKFQIQL